MSNWFKGYIEIQCTLSMVENSLENCGNHYLNVIKNMPGLKNVELVDEGDDFITIKTNEGIMKRTNISKTSEKDKITIKYDEEYDTGSMLTVKSHFIDNYKSSANNIVFETVISGVKTKGFMGLFYKLFGKSSIGNAFLSSCKTYLETYKKQS